MHRLTVLAVSLLVFSGCKKEAPLDPTRSTLASESSPRQASVEACALLTKEEVGSVQITTIVDAKSSVSEDGALSISQCYYSASEPSRSVSFTVTQSNAQASDPSEVRKYWQRTFGKYSEDREKEESKAKEKTAEGREEAERDIPPEHIANLGDESYWAGNRFGGVLYVLKNGFILRISVGGPGTPEVKLERSKALAEKALSRL